MTPHSRCSDDCFKQPICKICEKPKAPQGRDVPDVLANSFCTSDCLGYYNEPRSGHYWPQEYYF